MILVNVMHVGRQVTLSSSNKLNQDLRNNVRSKYKIYIPDSLNNIFMKYRNLLVRLSLKSCVDQKIEILRVK